MYQLIPSLTIPRAAPGDSHILVAPGVGFSLFSFARGALNQNKSSIMLKKKRDFRSSSFHMFVYARSEQCDLGSIYTITNTQHIKIYPGKLKLIVVKISPDPGRLQGKNATENQTLFTFLTTENLPGLPCSDECKYEPIQICCKFTWVNAFTP